MKAFNCKRCGRCCTDIGGRFSYKEIEKIERAFGELERMGIYLMIPPKDLSIPLFPEEARIMLDLSKNIGINFIPKPKLVIFDEKSDHPVVLEWDLGSRICPFYDKEGGCLIYRYRPLACRSFPVLLRNDSYDLLDVCPEVGYYKNMSDVEIERAFDKESIYAKKFNSKVEERKKEVLRMIRSREIIPRKIERRKIKIFRDKIVEEFIKISSQSF